MSESITTSPTSTIFWPAVKPNVEHHSDPRWLALKAQIEQYVALNETHVGLGGRDFTWYRVADPDELLEAAVAGQAGLSDAELDPFWAATWRAALGLDRFLASQSIAGQRVLELGCGSGQAGTGAAVRGAQVTSTDSVQLALMVAELNAWPVRERIHFRQLIWGRETLDADAFPIVIGSDLVYDPNLFPLLETCARSHLAEGGKLYLSEPHRHSGDKFSSWIAQAGWHRREHDVDLGDHRVPIRIFECWLQPEA